jgi:glyoxylase-like metal-dependent hydrolase (beta-lactamase superfamily II)
MGTYSEQNSNNVLTIYQYPWNQCRYRLGMKEYRWMNMDSRKVIHTPGHSSGSVSILLKTGGFCGDMAMNKFLTF